jgi:hypothetical protein
MFRAAPGGTSQESTCAELNETNCSVKSVFGIRANRHHTPVFIFRTRAVTIGAK